MTPEDEEFNRIERESDMRRKAISSALKDHQQHMLQYMSEYERGVIDGRSMQAKSSVDKAVNAMAFAKKELPNREWQGLTEDERDSILRSENSIFDMTEAILKAKNI